MKKLLFLLILAFNFSIAQEKIYTVDEVYSSPEFIGPEKSLMKFITQNFVMPEDVSVSGILEISFVVEVTGKISNIKITKNLGSGTGEEAVRVMQQSPKWLPGKLMDGTPVKVIYVLPITLKS